MMILNGQEIKGNNLPNIEQFIEIASYFIDYRIKDLSDDEKIMIYKAARFSFTNMRRHGKMRKFSDLITYYNSNMKKLKAGKKGNTY
jgi:hypothetical protein